MIKIIVGLGNPGLQYEKTRHNAGFVFLDQLVDIYNSRWVVSSQFQSEIVNLSIGDVKLILLKPMTFMNRSGSAVGAVLRYYKLKPEELLVVHDELELAEGVVRLKRDGGHAGHNGLRDIISHIDTRDFYRLRIGIGRPLQGKSVADYVLSKPSREGLFLIEKVCIQVIEKINLLVSGEMPEFDS